MADPSSDNIASFKEFTSCYDDALIIKFFQGANNNLESAVTAYFENPRRYDASNWEDENPFGDNYAAEPSNAFSIYPHEESNFISQSAAPTRPPSRASSMNVEADAQENGVIGSGNFSKVYSGHSDWQMTLAGDSNAVEIFPDIDAHNLARQQHEPVFMKPSGSKNFLPGLIAILGQIPVVQTVILQGPPMEKSYGNPQNWWSGTPVHSSSVVDAEASSSQHNNIELLKEVQRLFAFMRLSNKSYGNIEPLETLVQSCTLDATPGTSVADMVPRFLKSWSQAMSTVLHDGFPFDRIFRYVVSGTGSDNIDFYQLEIKLPKSPHQQTLYEAVDALIWDDVVGDSDEYRFLVEAPPILVIQVKNLDASSYGLNMQVPEEWFLDRYMVENREQAMRIRRDLTKHKKQLQEIDFEIKALDMIAPSSHSVTGNLQSVMQSAIHYLQEDVTDDSDDEDIMIVDSTAAQRSKTLAHRLGAVLDNLKTKLEDLNEQKRTIQEQLERLTAVMKEQTTDDEGIPQLKYRYKLRGVSTKSSNAYLHLASGEWADTWYYVEYTSAPSIERTSISLADVLSRASTDSHDALLVYAADEAHSAPLVPVPPALKRFVELDNTAFEAEGASSYNEYEQGWAPPATYTGYTNPWSADDPPPYAEGQGQQGQEDEMLLEEPLLRGMERDDDLQGGGTTQMEEVRTIAPSLTVTGAEGVETRVEDVGALGKEEGVRKRNSRGSFEGWT